MDDSNDWATTRSLWFKLGRAFFPDNPHLSHDQVQRLKPQSRHVKLTSTMYNPSEGRGSIFEVFHGNPFPQDPMPEEVAAKHQGAGERLEP